MVLVLRTISARDGVFRNCCGRDLMIDAPGEVDHKQLEELHLRVVKDE